MSQAEFDRAYAEPCDGIDAGAVAPCDLPDAAEDDALFLADIPDVGTRFDRWHRNGFTDLLQPAGQPAWTVRPESKVKQKDIAKTPAKLGSDGLADGLGAWTTRTPATAADARHWQRMGHPDMPANVSLRTGDIGSSLAYGALDCDVPDPALAEEIEKLADEHFGASPVRTRSNSSKWLRLYRLAPDAAGGSKVRREFSRHDLVETKDGKSVLPAVEFLRKGQQCIVEGLHSSGVPYEWPDGYPVADELPEIGQVAIDRFMAALAELLQQEGCTETKRSESGQKNARNDRTPVTARERVNKHALARLSEWVPDAFPEARKQSAGSYRITAEALGQSEYEEELSLHSSGIKDFGSERGMDAIGVLHVFCALEDDGTLTIAERGADGQRVGTISVDAATEWLADRLDLDLAKFRKEEEEAASRWFGAADIAKRAAPGGGTSNANESAPPDADQSDPTDFWLADADDVPDLPAGVVPAVIEGAARDHAVRLGVEAGAAAAALIGAMSSLVHAGNHLQMRQRDTGWVVRPILWTAIIAKSGTNKTATLGYALDAARSVDAKLRGEYALAIKKYDAQREAAKRRRKADPQAAQNYASPATTDILFEPEKPRFRQKIIRDATTEAIAEILADNPCGLLNFRDELSGFFGAMDAYRERSGVDRAFWLEAKDGGEFAVNRKKSDPILVKHNAVSVLGAIQPERFREICNAGSLTDDGLLQRFMPIELRSTGPGMDVAPDQSIANSLAAIAAALIEDNEPKRYRFAPDADQERCAYEAFVAREAERADALPAFAQWLHKSVSDFGRLALAFHFLEWHASAEGEITGGPPPDVVSVATARRARCYMTEFVYWHAKKFYRQVLGSSPAEENVCWIAGYILARKLATIANRDIQQAYTRLKSPERSGAVKTAMQHLCDHGWIKPARGQASYNAKSWTVNPAVHVKFAARAQAEHDRREAAREKIRRDVEARRAERDADMAGGV